MSARVPLIYGAAAIGAPGTFITRIHDLDECQKCIDLFVSKGHKVIDCARTYGDGTSEQYLAKLDLKGARVDTKCFPRQPGDHAPAKLRASLKESIQALSPVKIRVFYLHAPDRSVPYEDTLREINELYKEGLFEEFGISNYLSWEVAEIMTICKLNGWVKPTVYQGLYNALERNNEAELLPCLRKYGLRFYAFSPLANGLLAGVKTNAEAGSRWDPNSRVASRLHLRYKGYDAIFEELREVLAKNNIALAAAALRWLQHHSALTPNDAVIIGASRYSQLESNLNDSEGGPLPEEVVKMFEEAWVSYKGRAPPYAIH